MFLFFTDSKSYSNSPINFLFMLSRQCSFMLTWHNINLFLLSWHYTFMLAWRVNFTEVEASRALAVVHKP